MGVKRTRTSMRATKREGGRESNNKDSEMGRGEMTREERVVGIAR